MVVIYSVWQHLISNNMAFLSPFVFRGTRDIIPSIGGYDAVIWLESDKKVYSDAGVTEAIPGSSSVYQWNDLTTNQNDAIQTVSGDRPEYSTGTTCFNSLPVVSFTKSQTDHMRIPLDASYTTLTQLTLFLYLRGNNSFNVNDIFVQYSNDSINGGASDGWTVDYQTNLGADYIRMIYDDDQQTPNGYHEYSIPADYSTCNLYTIRISGRTITMWTGTTLVASNTSNGDGMDTPSGGQPMTIGASFSPGNPSPIDLGAYVLFNGPLTDANVLTIQNKILSKYS